MGSSLERGLGDNEGSCSRCWICLARVQGRRSVGRSRRGGGNKRRWFSATLHESWEPSDFGAPDAPEHFIRTRRHIVQERPCIHAQKAWLLDIPTGREGNWQWRRLARKPARLPFLCLVPANSPPHARHYFLPVTATNTANNPLLPCVWSLPFSTVLSVRL